MENEQITELTIYWDTQDRDNEGWAYRTNIDSGPIDGVADEDLDNAISEACRYLGIDLTPDQFARETVAEGGYAQWTADDQRPAKTAWIIQGKIDGQWDESAAGSETLYWRTQADAEAALNGPDGLLDSDPAYRANEWRIIEIEIGGEYYPERPYSDVD